MEAQLAAIVSVILVSLASLVGILVIPIHPARLQKIVFVLVSLSTGALFGNAFIHLIPSLFRGDEGNILPSLYILLGILAFFVLEKFFRWHHSHHMEGGDADDSIKHIGYMNLVSDGIHNFVDGVFIGIAYIVSIPLGIATTVAVFLHELPQEIGDFGILLHVGFTKARALFLNFISALSAVVGVFFALAFSAMVESLADIVIGITAGTFIYIAGSDLVPELHKTSDIKRSLLQFFVMAVGISIMYLLLLLE